MVKDYSQNCLSNKNLRGQNFKGKNLEGVSFLESDIRGVDFTDAILKGANFHSAKAGLEPFWAICLIIISFLLNTLLVSIVEILGQRSINTLISTNSGKTPENIWENLCIAIIIFVMFAVFIYNIRRGLEAAFQTTSVVGIILVILTDIHAFIQAVVGGVSGNVIESITGNFVRFIARTATGGITGIGIVAVAIAVAVVINVATIIGKTKARAIVIFGTLLIVIPAAILLYKAGADSSTVPVGVFLAIVGILLGNYLAKQALEGKKEYTLISSFTIFIASIGGTNFRGADLTDANFSQATLKSTDFRNATLTRTCWHQTKMLDYARLEQTNLKNSRVRHLVTTGQGNEQNFDYQDFRGLNLSKANLTFASFIGTNFYQASLQEADLSGAILVRSQFEQADLTNANLTGACIEDWVVTKTTKLFGVKCKYIFMKLSQKGDKYDQMPLKGEFKNDDFIIFVQSILDTIKLYHERDVNPNLALYVLQSLSEDYQCTLEIVKVEKRGESGAIIEVKVPGNLNEEQLKETYYDKYQKSFNLYMTDPKKELKPSTNIENITVHKGFVIGGDVSNSNIADTINQGDTTMTGERNINTGGGNYNERIERDYIQGNYYAAGQPQSLAEAAAEIQLLLKQLEQTYPTTTTSQQMVVAAEAINRIESNPTLKKRVINAVKEGGLAAFEKAIDNPAGAFIVGAIKGWQEVEAED